MRFSTRIAPVALAAAALFSSPVAAQTLTSEGTTIQRSLAERPAAERLIENFEKATSVAQLNTVQDANGNEGFLFGTSPFNFRVGQGFVLPDDVPAATVLGFDLYFVSKSATPPSTQYRVEVIPATSISTGPGATAHYSESFSVDDIVSDPDDLLPTEVRFAAPPLVTGPFFVSVRFDENVIADSLAIASTGQNPEVIDNSWLFFNNSWNNVNAIITSGTPPQPLQTYLWIDALIEDMPVSDEPTAASRSVRLSGAQPNPSFGQTNLALELDRALPVSVSVYDLLGRKVAEVGEQTLSAGAQQIRLDTSGLQNAVYVYRVRAGDETLTGRFTVVR